MPFRSSPTPCPWELRQKGRLTRRVLADQQSTNAVGSASIIGIICARWTGRTYKPLFGLTYRVSAMDMCDETRVLVQFCHYLSCCPRLRQVITVLRADTRAPLGNLSTLTDSVIDISSNSLAISDLLGGYCKARNRRGSSFQVEPKAV